MLSEEERTFSSAERFLSEEEMQETALLAVTGSSKEETEVEEEALCGEERTLSSEERHFSVTEDSVAEERLPAANNWRSCRSIL